MIGRTEHGGNVPGSVALICKEIFNVWKHTTTQKYRSIKSSLVV